MYIVLACAIFVAGQDAHAEHVVVNKEDPTDGHAKEMHLGEGTKLGEDTEMRIGNQDGAIKLVVPPRFDWKQCKSEVRLWD